METARKNVSYLMAGRSVKSVAEASGVGQSWLQRWLKPGSVGGIEKPNVKKMQMLASYFGVSFSDLMETDLTVSDSGGVSQSVSQQRQIIAATVTLVRYVQEMAVDPIPEDLTAELIDRATEEVMANWLEGFASDKEVAAAGRSVISKLRAR